MKLAIQIVFLFLIPQITAGEGIAEGSCKNGEVLVALVDYSYCTPKEEIESFRVLGGKHTTIHIITESVEYTFAKIPMSLTLLDIPKKNNISISTFFERLIDISYTSDGFSAIRGAFDIRQNTIVSSYLNNGISAYYIVNDASINNSIYLLNGSEEYIYLINGGFDESFAKKILSNLESKFCKSHNKKQLKMTFGTLPFVCVR